MAALGQLVVSLTANTAQFHSAMDKAAMQSARRFESMTAAAKRAGGAIGIAVTAAAGTLAYLVKNSIDAADANTKMAQAAGVSVETLTSLGYAAKLSGSSTEELGKTLGKLGKQISDAANGTGEAVTAFDAMGINVKDANGQLKTSDTILREVADKFATYQDGAGKSALAAKIFGDEGLKLIPMLNQGSAGMAAMEAEARQLGATIDTDTGKAAERFNDNITRLMTAKDGLINKIAAGLLPTMTNLTNRFVDSAKQSGAFEGAIKVLDVTLRGLVATGSIIYGVFDVLGKAIASVAAATMAVADGEFKQAWQILSMGGQDMVNSVQDSVDRTVNLWKSATGEMQAIANAPGGGLAAPAMAASSKVGEAKKEIERRANEITQIMKAAQDGVQRLTLGDEQMAVNRMRALGASPEQIAELQRLQAEMTKLMDLDRQLDEATRQAEENDRRAAEAKRALRDAGIRVYEDTRTPAERLNIEMARLNDLLAKGAIDWDTYSRAVFKAQDEFDSVGQKGEDTMDKLRQAIEGWGKASADAFVEFAFGAKASFGDLVNSILKDIARLMIYEKVTKPLFAAIGGAFGFANGGIMTSAGPAPLRAYAGGGIANSPQLALFGEGSTPEAFVPLPDGRTIPVTLQGGAGGGDTQVVVNVNMQSGSTEVQSQGGGAQLGRLIAGAVRQELINQRRPGGILAA